MARVAVVTGGTRGIGEAISKALKAAGYTVAANYGGNDAALGNFDNVITQRLRHRVQGQGAVDETLNIFEPAHRSLPVVIDDAKTLPN